MSQSMADADFDDIDGAFDQLEDQVQEEPVQEEPNGDELVGQAEDDDAMAEEEDDSPPGLELETEPSPELAETEAPVPAAEPETGEPPQVSKEETAVGGKTARKRPTFKKPAARKVVTNMSASKADDNKASASGASKAHEDDAENKPDNIQATDAAPDAAPAEEKSEAKKPEKAPVKSKKIPVVRKLKPAAAPPDPCNYTAPKEDDEDEDKPSKKATKAAGKKAKSDGPKLPSAKTAYFLFASEQRGPLKSENADLTFGEINKKLGEMWIGLSEEEKKPYAEQAEEEKARVEKLIQADPALLALREEKKSSGKKGSKASRGKETKPDKKLAVAANKVLKPVKKPAKKMAKKKAPAGTDDATDPAESEQPLTEGDEDAAEEESQDVERKGARTNRTSKRKANRAIRNEEQEESDEEYDWEADHEDCDWAAHPAECIVAVTNKQKYVVKRRGLPYHDYGLVPVNTAKRHCSGQEAGTSEAGRLTAEMINEFEQFRKEFAHETVDHTYCRELDLEDLDEGSKLEFCAFLGDLRREGVLVKPKKNHWEFDECTAPFGVMTLSFIVQRLVHSAVQAATAPLLKQIEVLQKDSSAAADQGMEA